MSSFSRVVYLEFGQETFRALVGESGWEAALERTPTGKLQPDSQEKLIAGLKDFLSQHAAGARASVCAIAARGVSVRRISMPPSSRGEWDKMIPLLIEREFPIAPEALAWGWQAFDNGAGAPEILIVAVKKDILEEYSKVLASAGLEPVFTLAAQARTAFVRQSRTDFILLDIGRSQAEMAAFTNGLPSGLRPLPLATPDGQPDPGSIKDLLESVASTKPVYLTGSSASAREFSQTLRASLPSGMTSEWIETPVGPGISAATLGLQKSFESREAPEPIKLESRAVVRRPERSAPTPAAWKWAAIAALLAIGCLAVRYFEPVVQKSRLTKRIAEMRSFRDRFPRIDRELGFLLYLKTNQPPYLDPLYAIAQAAPPGMKLESIALNRRGEVSWKAGMQNSQQVMDFRAKLVDSGLFSAVVVEEQTPTPDRQRLTIRMVAQWKPGAEAKVEPPKEDPKTALKKSGTNVVTSSSTNASTKGKNQP